MSPIHPHASLLRRGATTLLAALLPALAAAQEPDRADRAEDKAPPPIPEKTADMEPIPGFLPLYWDEARGRLWLEVDRFDQDLLLVHGLAAGLGSNDIGLDRGQVQGSRLVQFHRVGPKVLLVQPNLRFRGEGSPAEVRAVTDAFAPSVLWGFEVAAESDGRVLVDLTKFLLRDATDLAPRLSPGSYRFDESRSAVYRPGVLGFPRNTEVEALITFVRGAGDAGRGGGARRGAFEGVGSVAATGDAATLRVHHSFVQLPEEPFVPRPYHPGSGFNAFTYEDYTAPLDEPLTRRFLARHRLEKKDPTAAISEPVEPIVYHLDPGAPEPMRQALLEGARWWNQAFEAAGYRDAFQVELLPEDAHPLDIRYHVINWVHRSTRGWSYGGSVSDPRTGEILKGVVTLGSLRVRQDWLIAEGLLAPYEDGTEPADEVREWALARIRQLSAHEVGHTLGLSHNYYDSTRGRISVMDYPHPLVTLGPDGRLDASAVYAVGIGEWDKVAIDYGYRQFPPGADEAAALEGILRDAREQDLCFLTNQDLAVHPRSDQWSNGTQPAEELRRMMRVRRHALEHFGERVIRQGRPLATLEEALVPLYLHHRYQVDAAASALGGVEYLYALRGDGQDAVHPVDPVLQRDALHALLATLDPEELTLPPRILDLLPPRPPGYRGGRELFPGRTGPVFDALTPAEAAAGHTVAALLDPARAARLVQQRARNAALPGLTEVLDALRERVFEGPVLRGDQQAVRLVVQHVVVQGLLGLARTSSSPLVRAGTSAVLEQLHAELTAGRHARSEQDRQVHAELRRDLERFFQRQESPWTAPATEDPPPGAPIGQPALEWLRRAECSQGAAGGNGP